MATVRGRLLWHSISRSRKLAELSCDSARLLYTWMIPHADNLGRMDGEPSVLRAIVVPRLRHITEKNVEKWLGEMRDLGLILWYEVEDLRYIQLVGHGEHQRIVGNMKKTSDYPAPPAIQTELIPGANGGTPEGEGEEEAEEKPADSLPSEYTMKLKGKDGTYTPTVGQVAKWVALYRAVKVPAELAKMVAWFDANPSRRKTRRCIERSIVGWLGREQDKGRSSYDTPPRQSGPAFRIQEPHAPLPPAPTPEQMRANAAKLKDLTAKIGGKP